MFRIRDYEVEDRHELCAVPNDNCTEFGNFYNNVKCMKTYLGVVSPLVNLVTLNNK